MLPSNEVGHLIYGIKDESYALYQFWRCSLGFGNIQLQFWGIPAALNQFGFEFLVLATFCSFSLFTVWCLISLIYHFIGAAVL